MAGLRPGATLVEMSTVSPAAVRDLAPPVDRRGARPCSTPPCPAARSPSSQGQASIQVGGDAAALDRVRPYLAAIGPGGITHVGPLGLAKTMKIATNLGLAVQMLAFSEAVCSPRSRGSRARWPWRR